MASIFKDVLSNRLDVVAGLTAAAVVLPKAMAYATVAGLPVSIGLYTAFVPMIVYALLGTSRVLSVSSTTTLAILVGTALGLAVPDGDPGKLITATATLTVLTGALLIAASVLRLGFVANFHFVSRPDRLQSRHRSCDRARSGAEAARRALREGRLPSRYFECGAPFAEHVAAHPDYSHRGNHRSVGDGAAVAPFAGPARGGQRGDRALMVRRVRFPRRRHCGLHPAVAPADHPAQSRSRPAALARRAWHCIDELHRNDCRRPSLCSPSGPAHQSRPRTSCNWWRQPGRRFLRRHARWGRYLADRGGSRGRRAHANGISCHGRLPRPLPCSFWPRYSAYCPKPC